MTLRSSGEALSLFLANPVHGGIYRVALSQAQGLGESDGLCWHCLPAPWRWNRETLLDALAVSLAFPAHFGRNWDAAWDCLTELGWKAGKARVILVPAAPADGVAMAIFLELLSDACHHWAARGKSLAVLMVENGVWGEEDDDAGQVPEWLATVPPLPGSALGEETG
ncbi:MAG: barstar family protein [Halomonas sp.]|nr:barstar family protein [Halomonas sp.]MCA1772459.1 barstar family protein [Halomonas sp.]